MAASKRIAFAGGLVIFLEAAEAGRGGVADAWVARESRDFSAFHGLLTRSALHLRAPDLNET